MKKLFFLTALCVGSLSAMDQDPAEDPNQGNWTASYQTKIGEITHTPEYIKIGDFFKASGSGINMGLGSNFNGYTFPTETKLLVKSTKTEFEAQLKSSGLMKK